MELYEELAEAFDAAEGVPVTEAWFDAEQGAFQRLTAERQAREAERLKAEELAKRDENGTIMVCNVTHAIQRNEAESDFYLRVLPPAPTDEPQMVMMAGAVDSGDENQPVVAAGASAGNACGVCGGAGVFVAKTPFYHYNGIGYERHVSNTVKKCGCEAAKELSLANDWHWKIRFVLNKSYEFNLLNLALYSTDEQKNKADSGEKVVEFFLNETWILQPSNRSVYHSMKGDGKDCFKWVSNNNRELVIRKEAGGKPKLETSPEKTGTFNYGANDVDHVLWDILPYMFWGNTPEDTTPFIQRVHPKLPEAARKIITDIDPHTGIIP